MKSSKGSKREKMSAASGSRQHPMQEIIADDVSSIRLDGEGDGERYPGGDRQDGIEEGRSKRTAGGGASGAGSTRNRGKASGNAGNADQNALQAEESNIYPERSQRGKKGKKAGRDASVDSMDLEIIGKSEEFGQPGREDIYRRELYGKTGGAQSTSKQGS